MLIGQLVYFYFIFGLLAWILKLWINWVMKVSKIIKKKEPLTERMTLPMTESQLLRYRNVANELDKREETKLHDLHRDGLDKLLTDVEEYLQKSS